MIDIQQKIKEYNNFVEQVENERSQRINSIKKDIVENAYQQLYNDYKIEVGKSILVKENVGFSDTNRTVTQYLTVEHAYTTDINIFNYRSKRSNLYWKGFRDLGGYWKSTL